MDDWPLVGRAGDVAAIFDRLTRDPPVAVVIAGAAGVGKSRLAREVAERAEAEGWSTHLIVGTRAGASIPFGALAPFIADPPGDASSLDVLARVRSALAADGGPPKLLVVDDAQRLDPGSATLVHQVVADRVCRSVSTVRSGERGPDAIETLWAGGWADRIELTGLSPVDTDELLATVLGGPVDGATRRRLWETSGGNVLYLRELVLGAVADGSLRNEGGVWRQRGSTPVTTRLAELIEVRLATLDAETRAALDVVALAEQIDPDELAGLADLAALERLEDAGLITVVDDGIGTWVALAHPLYGEVVRASMPTLRRRRVSGAVADAVEAAGMPRPGDPVRVATWRLDAGQSVDADLLTTAARQAFVGNDLTLAERLGRAARDAGGGVDAGLVVAEVAVVGNRSEEALSLLEALSSQASTDEERVLVATARAHVLAAQLGRENAGIEVLDDALDGLTDPDQADLIRGRLAIIHAQAPRPAAAIAAAAPILARPSSPWLYQATYATSIALAVRGAADEAVRVGNQGYEAHASRSGTVRVGAETQFIGPVLAHHSAGRLDLADKLATRGYHDAVTNRDDESQATFALLRGLVATLQGRLIWAESCFREAVAINRALNDVTGLRWALGGVALASGLRGDPVEGAAACSELSTLERPSTQILELDLGARGEAWTRLAGGERTAATAILEDAADNAAATDQLAVEMLLRHDLARVGDARAQQARLSELSEQIDGDLSAALAEHARALATRAGRPLEDAANRLAELGVNLVAHEAAVDAAAAYRAEGLRRRAAACDELARRQAAKCEGARSPVTTYEVGFVTLTPREREVADLAASGATSREIGQRLYLSHRTVENHLQRIYEKLGVTNRQQLDEVLRSPRPVS